MSSYTCDRFFACHDNLLKKIQQYMETHVGSHQRGLMKILKTEIDLQECINLFEKHKRTHSELIATNRQLKDAPPRVNITNNQINILTKNINNNYLTNSDLIEEIFRTFNRAIVNHGGKALIYDEIDFGTSPLPALTQDNLLANMNNIGTQLYNALEDKKDQSWLLENVENVMNDIFKDLETFHKNNLDNVEHGNTTRVSLVEETAAQVSLFEETAALVAPQAAAVTRASFHVSNKRPLDGSNNYCYKKKSKLHGDCEQVSRIY